MKITIPLPIYRHYKISSHYQVNNKSLVTNKVRIPGVYRLAETKTLPKVWDKDSDQGLGCILRQPRLTSEVMVLILIHLYDNKGSIYTLN